MPGPQNSILSDPTPHLPPKMQDQTTAKLRAKVSDWARLGKSRKYKEVDNYMEARKEYWRHYLPGGEALRELAIRDREAAGIWASVASTIVDEIEMIQFKVQVEKDSVNG